MLTISEASVHHHVGEEKDTRDLYMREREREKERGGEGEGECMHHLASPVPLELLNPSGFWVVPLILKVDLVILAKLL